MKRGLKAENKTVAAQRKLFETEDQEAEKINMSVESICTPNPVKPIIYREGKNYRCTTCVGSAYTSAAAARRHAAT